MRLVIQRVREASVTIDGKVFSSIGAGLFILVGVEDGDTEDDAAWLASKAAGAPDTARVRGHYVP